MCAQPCQALSSCRLQGKGLGEHKVSAQLSAVPGAEHSGHPCRWQLLALSTSGAILKALSLFPLKVCALAEGQGLPMGFGRLCPWGWL